MKLEKYPLLPLAAICGLALAAQAGTVTVNGTAPTADGEDIANLTWTTSSEEKVFADSDGNLGQSFTTGSDAGGYVLSSFSFQNNRLSHATDSHGARTYDIRVVAIDGSNDTTTVTLETGHVQAAGTFAIGDWFTWTLDTPVNLSPNTLYGVDVEHVSGTDWDKGIPYMRFENNDVAAGGSFYQRADGDPGTVSPNTGRDYVFHVNLALGTDNTAPDYTILLPADGAPDAAAAGNLVITFDENVQKGGTGSITIKNSGGSDFEVIPIGDSRIDASGTVVTIDPDASLVSGNSYYVLIDSTAIMDFATTANFFAGFSNPDDWNFTVAPVDTTPPELNTVDPLSPADGDMGVAVDTNLVITFDETVQKGSGNIVITKTGGSIFESIPVGDGRVSVSGAVVTINPNGTLDYGTDYHVEVGSTVFKNLANLDFIGISGPTAWNFTTVAAPLVGTLTTSATAPAVSGLNQANLETSTEAQSIWTDRSVQGNTFTSDSPGGELRSITVQLDDGDSTITGWKDYIVRVGTVTLGSPNVFNEITAETIRQESDIASGSWFTFTLGSPITLAPGTLYGFQVGLADSEDGHGDGIPQLSATGDVFAGGQRFTGESPGDGLGTAANLQSGDLVFHLDIAHPMTPSPFRVTVAGGSVPLTWTNLSPNVGSDVWVDVWFGTDSESLSQVVFAGVDGQNTESVTVTAPVANTYYWRVDSYLEGVPTGTPVESDLFEFYIDDTDGDGFPDTYELIYTDPASNIDLNPGDDLENGGLGDGLTNWEEYQLGTYPDDPDSDIDGLLDGASIAVGSGDARYTEWAIAGIAYSESGGLRTFRGESTMGTDPLVDDTDGDDLLDGVESNTGIWVDAFTDTGTSPTDADWDNDGLKDGVETRTGFMFDRTTDTGTDPYLPDSDSDGAGDWYEVAATFTDPSSDTETPDIPYPLPDPDGSTGTPGVPVKVYIMSGQSNMVGIGYRDGSEPGSLTTIAKSENKFPNLVDGSNNWTERDDVIYKGVVTAKAAGPLTAGQGAGDGPGPSDKIGPELGFGHVMGWYHDEPVLLIKSSQGNRGIAWDFLPPGSAQYTVGGVTYAGYGDQDKEWDEIEPIDTPPGPYDASSESGWYAGKQFDDCFLDEGDWHPNGAAFDSITNVADILSGSGGTLQNLPGGPDTLNGRTYEIAGFVWWQGHWEGGEQDTGTASVYANRYEENLVNLIDTLRAEFGAPTTPFVVATIGFGGGGWDSGSSGDVIYNAQLAVGDPGQYPLYDGNVASVDTTGYWRELDESPGPEGYHYNNNAETYTLVGDAMGRAMIELLGGGTTPTDYDTWATTEGYWNPGDPKSGPTEDFDGDGLTNEYEYAFALDPTDGSSVSPITPLDKAGGTFTYTRRDPALTGLTYSYESSLTLGSASWLPMTPDLESPAGTPDQVVTVTVPDALLANPELFVRVLATE